MQWLARLPGTQEIRGSSPGRSMTDFCTSIFICLYTQQKSSAQVGVRVNSVLTRNGCI